MVDAHNAWSTNGIGLAKPRSKIKHWSIQPLSKERYTGFNCCMASCFTSRRWTCYTQRFCKTSLAAYRENHTYCVDLFSLCILDIYCSSIFIICMNIQCRWTLVFINVYSLNVPVRTYWEQYFLNNTEHLKFTTSRWSFWNIYHCTVIFL